MNKHFTLKIYVNFDNCSEIIDLFQIKSILGKIFGTQFFFLIFSFRLFSFHFSAMSYFNDIYFVFKLEFKFNLFFGIFNIKESQFKRNLNTRNYRVNCQGISYLISLDFKQTVNYAH